MANRKIKVALKDVNYRADEETPTLNEWQGWNSGDVIECEITDKGDVLAIATHDSEHCKAGDYTALESCEFKILEEA